ncbi:MAG: PEP-CTERM sorting domain-containing protein [Terrimicrobiaceae bacterium]|nr:PEP-CTERM sorting domain-containing protein [Terrimicrobiaceae bacterium]
MKSGVWSFSVATLVAFAAGVTHSEAQTYNESFTGNSLPSGFSVVFASGQGITPSVSYTSNGVVFNNTNEAHRVFLRTDFNNYIANDFTASLVAEIPDNIFFFGIGKAASIIYPEPTDVIGTRSHSVSWGQQNGFIDGTTTSSLGSANFSDYASQFVLQWTASTRTAVFTIYDYNSSGGLVATHSRTIDGSNNGFTANNSYLYFGGAEGITVRNFVVIPEPSTFASLLAAAALGLTVVRRRQR